MDERGLEERIGGAAATLHAATAQLVDLATTFDDKARWSGIGMRSCAHWLTIATGIDLWNSREMLRAGHALRTLPLIHEAFCSGRLSFDKVRSLTRVATADDESFWLELALSASGAQLARICRAYRFTIAVDDPNRAQLQRARRRVVSWWLDEDGMLALYATLPPEEGTLVLRAIGSAVSAGPSVDGSSVQNDPCAGGEADHPFAARRADALVRICEGWLHNAARSDASAPPGGTLVVHVDADVLGGADDGGRCHIEDGPAIPLTHARRVACDAQVVTVTERDGVAVDAGRSRRVVSGRLRRLLNTRDQGCRYPGCSVPAVATEGHHIVHWADGGRTDLANLVSLCRFHHHRHHEGAFRVTAESGELRFEAADGRAIEVWRTSLPHDAASRVPRPGCVTAGPGTVAEGFGQRFDLDHTVTVVAGNIANARARRLGQPSGP